MRLLPSERENRVVKAIADFKENGKLTIWEPCDCGFQIRHINGGNYHDIIYLQRDGDKTFVKYDTTCELTPDPEWDVCDSWEDIIRQHADWL